MSKKNNDSPLHSFMKKQISQKSSEKNLKNQSSKVLKEKSDRKLNEEEEKLDRAKRKSIIKAARYDQSGMFKKLILENTTRFFLVVALSAILGIGVIQLLPKFFVFVSGIIPKLFRVFFH